MSSPTANDLGYVLVNFSKDGTYPEEEATSAAQVDDAVLPAALEALRSAKEDLVSEIKQISRESAPDVDSWIVHARAIQNDIQESKKLANNIARIVQESEQQLDALQEQENYEIFLRREVGFQHQLLISLNAIQGVHHMLNEAEDLAVRSQITEALQKLDAAGEAYTKIPMEKDARAMRLLQIKHTELQDLIHGQFTTAWNALVKFDREKGTLTIREKLPSFSMDISGTLEGLQTFHDVDRAAQRFCEDMEILIIGPRTDVNNSSTPSVKIEKNSLGLNGTTDHTIKSLFVDLQKVIEFLNESLPADFISMVASLMMPPLSQRILETWLYSAVPASLDDMVDYQKALALVFEFARALDLLKWPGSEGFQDWVTSAPRIWLSKRRETALDWTRNQMALGLGSPHLAERVEKQMVDREEAKELVAATSGSAVTQEWDSAWSSDDEDEASVPSVERNRRSLEEERRASSIEIPSNPPTTDGDDEDDAADAWGWGDEDDTAVPAASTAPTPLKALALHSTTREMTLSEKYWISSIPQPVLTSIKKLYEDGARLTQPETEHVPIAAAAPGLFSLPTLVLAMYRAVSPLYYTSQPGGNMYLYNDAMWLSESFAKCLAEWNARTDLTPRAYGMVKLEPEIKVLAIFGRRAYTNELTEQRLIINDLFGGTQNFFQQDVSPGRHSLNDNIDPVIHHVREQAEIWKKILPFSAWASATGSLVNTVASRIITDVFDLTDISVDEAERIATVIARVQTMDDMFLKDGLPGHSTSNGEKIPLTSRFADQWLKMAFLSEFLQSNLTQIKFLWLDSDLSLYFTVDEVMELIGLSFEKNQAVRAAMKQIRDNPSPRGA